MPAQAPIVVIVPCFNERDAVTAFIVAAAEMLVERLGCQIVLIDDGSTDDTSMVISQLIESRPEFGLIRLSSNTAKDGAILAGLDYASTFGAACLIMDVDGQHPFGIAAEMVTHFRNTGQGCAGRRLEPSRRLGTRLATRLFYLAIAGASGYEIDGFGDFRLLTPAEVVRLSAHRERVRFSKLLYASVVASPREFPFVAPESTGRRSSRWTLSQLVDHGLDGLVNSRRRFSRALVLSSLIIMTFSLLYGVTVLIDVAGNDRAGSGIASILVLVLFFGSLQILLLAVLGEYVVRILVEAKRRPNYGVRDTINLVGYSPPFDTRP